MSRIIFTSRYIKAGTKKQLKNLINYMATRPGVELNKNDKRAATDRQKKFIEEQVKLIPDIKDSFEYEDYINNPTVYNASELIRSTAEKYNDDPEGLKNYVEYIAKRPRAERSSEGHGLWSSGNEPISLEKVSEQVSNHKGYIWTHVISLHREDAERLGYNNAQEWKNLVKSKIPIIAESMNIPIDKLKWYGAFHNEGHHPHIHLLVYSEDKNRGYLTEKGIEKMRQIFGTTIFHDDLLNIYSQKDDMRKYVNETADKKIKKILENIEKNKAADPVITEMLIKLSKELKNVKGKKQYGWLDRNKKQLVNNIVAELGKDKNISELYKNWCNLKSEVAKTYTKNPPPFGSLEDEKEFTKIKNMIIKYAICVGENIDIAAEEKYSEVNNTDEQVQDEIEQDYYYTEIKRKGKTSKMSYWSDEYKMAREYIYKSKTNFEKAYKILLNESSNGNVYAFFDLGIMAEKNLLPEKLPITESDNYFKKALKGFLEEESKDSNEFLEYKIGTMYKNGQGADVDFYKAFEWLKKSADKNNQYAQYSLGKLYIEGKGIEQSYEKALEYYMKSAEHKNSFAAYEAAKMFEKGIGTEIDINKSYDYYAVAFNKFKVSAATEENRELKAMFNYKLSKMCQKGLGTEIDKEKSKSYLKNAADLENIYACYDYGIITLTEAQTEDEKLNAQEYLNKALLGFIKEESKSHDVQLQYRIGVMYEKGYGIDANIDEAIKWLRLAAEQKNAYAAYELGDIYTESIDIESNMELSQKYYEIAYKEFVNQINSVNKNRILYKLGKMCLEVKGIEKDVQKAAEYFQKSALENNCYAALSFIKLNREYKLNFDMSEVVKNLIASAEKNSMSQYVLGYYYMFCESDKEQALFWLEQSAANGNEYAKNLIEYINNYNYYVSPSQAVISLLNNLSKIIEEDYQMKQKQFEKTDRKLLSKIAQKKQALGQKLN